MKNRILCACVIYPGVIKYIKKFTSCINNQSSKSFDLLIVNNNCGEVNYQFTCEYFILDSEDDNPIINRKKIIEYAIEKEYEKLIFFDSDDLYYKDRIKILSKYLDSYAIAVHNMSIINENEEVVKEKMFPKNLRTGKILFEDVVNHNFSGLGNSGYQVKILSEIINEVTNVSNNIIAFDWWLALNILLNHNGYFIDICLTEYRRYDLNSTSLNNSNTAVIKEFQVKKLLYNELITKSKLNSERLVLIKQMEKELDKKISNYDKKLTDKNEYWWDILS